MSFFTLLVLLSLIIIVPIFLVIKERSKNSQLDLTQRHQEYLVAASNPVTDNKVIATEVMTNANDKSKQITIIEFSPRHPFVKQLYNEQVPKAFRAVMDDIGQQYERTHHYQLTESQLFTLNKLIAIRIPELISDYLSLDPNYAKTVAIDVNKTITSYSMVLGQLQSILDVAQKLNEQSQSGVVDKLLASRRYLDEVSQDNSIENDILNLK